MLNTDELNNIFSFKDAVKAVENILHEARERRDSYGWSRVDEGLSPDWQAYHRENATVEGIEDVMDALLSESRIMHHINAVDEREE